MSTEHGGFLHDVFWRGLEVISSQYCELLWHFLMIPFVGPKLFVWFLYKTSIILQVPQLWLFYSCSCGNSLVSAEDQPIFVCLVSLFTMKPSMFDSPQYLEIVWAQWPRVNAHHCRNPRNRKAEEKFSLNRAGAWLEDSGDQGGQQGCQDQDQVVESRLIQKSEEVSWVKE